MSKISLIIPVYNALDDVKECLKSVAKNFEKTNNEVIVIDDYSKEDTQKFLKNFAKENSFIKLYKNKENLGFIKTCNSGISKASGDIIVLLNSDTIIPKSFCKKILKAFSADKNIGIACPIPSNGGHFSLGEPPIGTNIESVNKLLEQKHKTTYPRLSSCNGFCFCIKKEVIKKIGLLDEVYGRGYHEEVDFCYKAINAGFQCALIDNLYILHKRHASFGSKERDALIAKNNIIFNQRWKNFKYDWNEKHPQTNPVTIIKEELFGKKTKIFKIIKKGNYRLVYLLGLKIFSYKKGRKK